MLHATALPVIVMRITSILPSLAEREQQVKIFPAVQLVSSTNRNKRGRERDSHIKSFQVLTSSTFLSLTKKKKDDIIYKYIKFWRGKVCAKIIRLNNGLKRVFI